LQESLQIGSNVRNWEPIYGADQLRCADLPLGIRLRTLLEIDVTAL